MENFDYSLVTYTISVIVLAFAAIFIHAFGSYLLWTLKRDEGKIQRMLLINLSFVEILVNCFSLLYVPIHVFMKIPRNSIAVYYRMQRYAIFINITSNYMLFILSSTYITVNRLLEINLNIKYELHVTPRRVRYLIVSTWMLALALAVVLSVIEKYHPGSIFYVMDLYLVYVQTCLEITFLLLAITTYFFIFKKFVKSRQCPNVSYNSMETKHANTQSLFTIFRNSDFFVYVYLTLNIILFTVIPQLVFFIVDNVYANTVQVTIQRIREIMMMLSHIFDAVIYILLDRSVRTHLHKVCCNGGRGRMSDQEMKRLETKK